jgi:predicted DNA-binding WGR domain protein
MKKIFTLKDRTSDKFWTITADGAKLTTNYGKIRNTVLSSDKSSSLRGYQWPTGDITQRIGEGGQAAEKEFEDTALCKKEAEKQITKKIKEGYAEQEKLFIDLDEGMQLFQIKELIDDDDDKTQTGNPKK